MDVVSFPTTTDPTPPPARVSCAHDRLEVGEFLLDICPQSDEGRWLDRSGDELDALLALAQLFGSFDLTGVLEAIAAPGPTVLAYRPDSRRGRQALRSLPRRRWVEAAPSLWITTDGDRLLMAPVDQLLADNLARDLSRAEADRLERNSSC